MANSVTTMAPMAARLVPARLARSSTCVPLELAASFVCTQRALLVADVELVVTHALLAGMLLGVQGSACVRLAMEPTWIGAWHLPQYCLAAESTGMSKRLRVDFLGQHCYWYVSS